MSYEDLLCRDFVELVSDYLDGVLSSDARLVVELHLAFCAPCVDYLDQMRTTLAVTGALHGDQIPQPVVDSLVAAFRAVRSAAD